MHYDSNAANGSSMGSMHYSSSMGSMPYDSNWQDSYYSTPASYASHTGMIHGSSTGQAASSYSPSYSPPTNGATHGIPAFAGHPSSNMVMAYCSYNNLAQQKASASCAAACQPAKDCASGNPSINCEAWKPWCMGAFVDNSSMDQHGNSGGSYGSSGGSYGSSGSNGHANPAAKCQKCHTADKPMGVNCFTSLADMMNGGQPIEGKGGLLLGTVCAGTEYTQTYTCTQAYDYNFKNRAAADGACAHYKNLCCTAPTPAPTPSESSYGSYGSYGTSMQSSNGNSGVSYGSSAPVSPTNDMLISGLKQLISGMAMDTPTQEKVQQKIRELEAALAGCGGAAVAPSGPMQELTCGGAAGVAQQQVKFMPFDKAFGPNLQAEIAAAKASGNRVCFCR